MTANAFGGEWTEDKLQALQKYLEFYVQAMKAQPFRLIYFDSFAGTGRCRIKASPGTTRDIDGSAKLALDCDGFSRYHFIEHKKRHADELQELISMHPRGALATLARGTAHDMLWPLLTGYDWKSCRGVLFLDPYGLQCDWAMLNRIAATQALDVFFLVSLSGIYRNAARKLDAVDDGKAALLDRFLGTDGWRAAVYEPPRQSDMFNTDPSHERKQGYRGLLQFTTKRIRLAFPYVSEPRLLGSANGAPLFAFYFVVSNPSKKALELATKVGEHIMRDVGRPAS